MDLLATLSIIFLSSFLIFHISERFATASSYIGDWLGLSRSVKGATLDAIASSLPELLVALFAVIFFQSFEIGIGTIAGSALFNLLIIPGVAVLVAPVAFKISPKVFSRDALFYVISVFMLVVITFYFGVWGAGIAIALLLVYAHYVQIIVDHTKKGEEEVKELPKEVRISKEFWWAGGLVLAIGAVTYILTEASSELAHILDISPVIIAFVVTAAATSIPDTVISVSNARKGDISDAASNVFGSNIFDILVGLGLPLLIYVLITGKNVVIDFPYTEILFGLLGATIMVLYFFAEDHVLSKGRGIFLLFLYGLFLVYVVMLSLGRGVVGI